MRGTTTYVIVLSLALMTAGISTSLATLDEDAGDNGLVYMVHGHFEPAITDEIPPPPAHEAFATTQDSGEIILYVIPYSTEEEAPVPFEDDAQVELNGPLPGQSITLDPREGTPEDERCVDETTIEGHEGDIGDCLVAKLPAETVRGWGAVDIVFSGTLATTGEHLGETYSSPAHIAIHTTMEDGAPGFEAADQLSSVGTPFLVEDLIDPVE